MADRALRPAAAGERIFTVDPSVHLLGHALERAPRALRWLGDLESRALRERLGEIDRPVYVAGLARAGSTLLLELLSWQPEVVTHRYRDFPLVHVPYLWNRFLDLAGGRAAGPTERAHRDGVLVDRDSPEAFEEVLWMAFFPQLHQPGHSDVLDAHTRHPQFEAFYRDHVRKLMLVRGGTRYLSKGNYNVTRLEYLLHLFPDARFVVPVREPVAHVASLMQQHDRFSTGQREEPKARVHLRRAGHFEFGDDRRAIHTGDAAAVEEVLACWRNGHEVEGWAYYWKLIYAHVARRLAANPALAAATRIVPFETLCREPVTTAWALLEHCGFEANAAMLGRVARHVRSERRSDGLEAAARQRIERITEDTRASLLALDSVVAPPTEH